MAALLLALILSVLLDQGTATQRTAMAWGNRDGSPLPAAGLMLVAGGVAILFAILGDMLSVMLPGPANQLFLAVCLLLSTASTAMAAVRARPHAAASPRSASTLIGFAVRRAGENGALVLSGIAAFTGAPLMTALGGVAGTVAALSAPLCLGRDYARIMPMRAIAIMATIVLFGIGLWCATSALALL